MCCGSPLDSHVDSTLPMAPRRSRAPPLRVMARGRVRKAIERGRRLPLDTLDAAALPIGVPPRAVAMLLWELAAVGLACSCAITDSRIAVASRWTDACVGLACDAATPLAPACGMAPGAICAWARKR